MRLLDLFEHSVTPQIMSATIRRVADEYLADGSVACLYDIGNGHCENFAYDVLDQLRDYGVDPHALGDSSGVQVYAIEDFWEDDFYASTDRIRAAGETLPPNVPEEKLKQVLGGATHVWLKFQDRYYDAEAPEGVERFLELPFFARYIEHLQQAGNTLSEATNRTLYHGSYSSGAFKRITTQGLQGRADQTRHSLAPIKGRVYMTPSLRYAIIYALGGDMMGHKMPEGFIKPGLRYGYVYEIDPADLTDDVIPDEDIVGAALVGAYRIQKGRVNQYSALERELAERPNLVSRLAYLFDAYTRAVPTIRKGALEGMLASEAKLGKRVLKDHGRHSADMQAILSLENMHQSHGGTVMPTRAWRIDRRLSHKLLKDGSNFFDIATKVWERPNVSVAESRVELSELIGYDEAQKYIPGVVKNLIDQFGSDSGLEYEAYTEFTDKFFDWIESITGEEPDYNDLNTIMGDHPEIKQKFWDWLPSYMTSRVTAGFYDIVGRSSHQNGMVSLYRAIQAPANWYPDHIEDRPLGIYWSFEMDSAEAHWAGGGEYTWLIEARAPISAIDWPITLENKIIYEGEDEIRVLAGTTVEVDQIYVEEYSGSGWNLPEELNPDYPEFIPQSMVT